MSDVPRSTRAFSAAVGSEVKNGVTEVRLGVVVETFSRSVASVLADRGSCDLLG